MWCANIKYIQSFFQGTYEILNGANMENICMYSKNFKVESTEMHGNYNQTEPNTQSKNFKVESTEMYGNTVLIYCVQE